VGSGPWETAFKALGPSRDWRLYSDFVLHPSPLGSYMAALKLYECSFGPTTTSAALRYLPRKLSRAEAVAATQWVHAVQ